MADKKQLEEIAKRTDNDKIRKAALDAIENEFKGDEVAQKMIRLTQIINSAKNQGAAVDAKEVKKIVKEIIADDKISFSDLDAEVQKMIRAGGGGGGSRTVNVNITKGGQTKVVSINTEESDRPLIQKVLSDVLARNNVYLYGMAGTGKTFSAQTIANVLDWDLIEVSCNQFTSPLELIGGQTIDGYQEGKVTRAYGNLDMYGNPRDKGCVLLLDELPKLDPNTAGVLNQVLARVGEFDSKGNPKSIENGRGEKIRRGNVFIMATGNTLLNTASKDYEANFKQDLSLQDRFVGSTYEVFVDVEFEWYGILKERWAFIAIYLNKLRNLIVEEGFENKAFVSIRIMQSVQKTFNVFRTLSIASAKKSKSIESNPAVSYTPMDNGRAIGALEDSKTKTVEDSMNEFLSLFNDEQRAILKEKSNYSEFVAIEKTKRKLPEDKINTPEELKRMDEIIAEAKAKHSY